MPAHQLVIFLFTTVLCAVKYLPSKHASLLSQRLSTFLASVHSGASAVFLWTENSGWRIHCWMGQGDIMMSLLEGWHAVYPWSVRAVVPNLWAKDPVWQSEEKSEGWFYGSKRRRVKRRSSAASLFNVFHSLSSAVRCFLQPVAATSVYMRSAVVFTPNSLSLPLNCHMWVALMKCERKLEIGLKKGSFLITHHVLIIFIGL